MSSEISSISKPLAKTSPRPETALADDKEDNKKCGLEVRFTETFSFLEKSLECFSIVVDLVVDNRERNRE